MTREDLREWKRRGYQESRDYLIGGMADVGARSRTRFSFSFSSFSFLVLLVLLISPAFSKDIYLNSLALISTTRNYNFSEPEIWIGGVVPGIADIAHLNTTSSFFNVTINSTISLEGLVVGDPIYNFPNLIIAPNVILNLSQNLQIFKSAKVVAYEGSEIIAQDFSSSGGVLVASGTSLTFFGDFSSVSSKIYGYLYFYNCTITTGSFLLNYTRLYLESSQLSVNSWKTSYSDVLLHNGTIHSNPFLEITQKTIVCGSGTLVGEVSVGGSAPVSVLGACVFDDLNDPYRLPNILSTSQIFIQGGLKTQSSSIINLSNGFTQYYLSLIHGSVDVTGCVNIQVGSTFKVNQSRITGWGDYLNFTNVITSSSSCLNGTFTNFAYYDSGSFREFLSSPFSTPSFTYTSSSFSFALYLGVSSNQESSLVAPSTPPSSFTYLPLWAYAGLGAGTALLLSLGIVILGTRSRRRCDQVEESELISEIPEGERKPLLGGREEGRRKREVDDEESGSLPTHVLPSSLPNSSSGSPSALNSISPPRPGEDD